MLFGREDNSTEILILDHFSSRHNNEPDEMGIERRSKHEYVVPGSISPVGILSSLNQFPSRFQYMKASRGVAPDSSTGRLIRSISGTKCRATRLRPRPTTPLLPPHNQSSYTKTTSGNAAHLNPSTPGNSNNPLAHHKSDTLSQLNPSSSQN